MASAISTRVALDNVHHLMHNGPARFTFELTAKPFRIHGDRRPECISRDALHLFIAALLIFILVDLSFVDGGVQLIIF